MWGNQRDNNEFVPILIVKILLLNSMYILFRSCSFGIMKICFNIKLDKKLKKQKMHYLWDNI